MEGLLSEFINRLLNEYSIVKNEKFAGNEFDDYIRTEVPKNICGTLLANKEKYLVQGSVGRGQWADMPWVAVFHNDITDNAGKGVYIIYLLSKDGNSVFITLNQGYTDIKKRYKRENETIANMRSTVEKIVGKIGQRGFEAGNNNNPELNGLGKYKSGTIFYKKYTKGEVPEESVLEDDLNRMLEIYEEYVDNELVGMKGKADTMETTKTINLNTILYGPPGTGKTYNTAIYAVAICDGLSLEVVSKWKYEDILKRYNELKNVEKRVAFTTFHQSYGYEEFIEGIKPKMDSESKDVEYTIKDGVFKEFCERASNKKVKTAKIQVRENAAVWNVILGGTESPDLKDKCFDEGTIRIGWNNYPPTIPETITEETKALNNKERRILLNFQDEMEIGDIVVVRSTASAVDGIGIVKGEPQFDSSIEKYPRKREVEWLCTGKDIEIIDLNGGIRLDRKTVYRLSRISAGDLLSRLPADSGVNVEDEDRPYVFVIDEINRGNISKIFGELITLIEPTKRKGADEAMEALLPYSNMPFSVPKNVYLIGTMNTADRSIALMDTALRRRFRFEEMMPNSQVLRDIGADVISDNGVKLDVAKMLDTINRRIEYLYDREHTIGHAFFTGLKNDPTIEKLAGIFRNSIIPLLQEYFYEGYSRIMLVLGDNGKKDPDHKFILEEDTSAINIFRGDTSDIDIPDCSYKIQEKAFYNIMSYVEIMD